jgi:hypothetical protein
MPPMKRAIVKKAPARDRGNKCDDRRSKTLKEDQKPGDRGACENKTTSQGGE